MTCYGGVTSGMMWCAVPRAVLCYASATERLPCVVHCCLPACAFLAVLTLRQHLLLLYLEYQFNTTHCLPWVADTPVLPLQHTCADPGLCLLAQEGCRPWHRNTWYCSL
jgi:hypothetical protein